MDGPREPQSSRAYAQQASMDGPREPQSSRAYAQQASRRASRLPTPLSRQLTRRLSAADANGDGKVNWQEFVKARNRGEDLEMPANASEVLRQIVIYIAFIAVFTLHSIRGLQNASNFYFAENIRGQFVGVEVAEEHSPSFAKTFEDVATVEEAWHWMLGPFVHTAFSPNTFDGDPSWDFDGGKPLGNTLGSGKFIGAVRISQLRVSGRDCTDQIHSKLAFNWTCYGNEVNGDFTKDVEERGNFSEFIEHKYPGVCPANQSCGWLDNAIPIGSRGNFTFDGMKGIGGGPLFETVDEQRGKILSSFTSNTLRFKYPSPAYAITLSPLIGVDKARKVIKDLWLSNYVDLHTRAIFVDASVYNPMLGQLCFCRMVFELSPAGGVIPTFFFQPIKLFETVTDEDSYYLMLLIIVGLFYLYYMRQLYCKYKLEGRRIFNEFLTIAQILNFLFFFCSVGFRYYAEALFPASIDVQGDEYLDALPCVNFKVWAVSVAGVNVFLNWFKFIQVLSYSPVFGLINLTLGKSAANVGGFGVVFFVIFYGFTQAHCMIFQGRLFAFRSLSESIFTLMRSLLGDFDFEELQYANYIMGPLLFILFIVLAVFVVLNMLISIISDAYDSSKEEMKGKPKVSLLLDVRDYLLFRTIRNPDAQKFFVAYFPRTLNTFFKHMKMDMAVASNTSIVPDDQLTDELLVVSSVPREFDVLVPDDMGGEPLGLELEQYFDHVSGSVRGVSVVVPPTAGPLKGKVRAGDELIRINGDPLGNASLVDVGDLLRQTSILAAAGGAGGGRGAPMKRLSFRRAGLGQGSENGAGNQLAVGGGSSGEGGGGMDTAASAEELLKLRAEMMEMRRMFEGEMREMHITMQKMVSLMGTTPTMRV